ncbi:biotin transporter BioY [Natronosalvus halobius]|uniref:biotin transporter BioY n=1 Tax=Natronosalvus halobius TaxID=2953746 RepID=UPI0020A171BE|nr:biotin transporter BioY [Natronosalvus halobius]USZ71663.1 biotin transporter BioY [Natronosalvus halobius]
MATSTENVDLVGGDVVRSFARAALLAVLIGASAYVSIPLPVSPVPFTLQVLFVFLAGLVLGPVWGAVSMVLYLAAGAIGVPVFAGGVGGVGHLFGYTGGYLWSYPIAAFVIGLLVHQGWRVRDPATIQKTTLAAALLVGLGIIYGLGVPWLAWVQSLSLAEAAIIGMAYYVPLDLVKLAAAIAIVRSERIPVA